MKVSPVPLFSKRKVRFKYKGNYTNNMTKEEIRRLMEESQKRVDELHASVEENSKEVAKIIKELDRVL